MFGSGWAGDTGSLVRPVVLGVLYLGYEAIYGAAVTNNNLADGSQPN